MRPAAVPLAVVLALAAGAACAAPKVAAAWSRPAAAGTTGAGFMTLTGGGAADSLVGVTSPAARKVEMHRSSVSGGVASMQAVRAVAVPAGGSVTFAPGGYHLMFLGLTRPLKTGDRLPATLTFASGAKVTVSFVVGLAPPVDGHHHH